jgi:dynein heavy chain
VAAGKRTQLQLEDTVLHLLSTASGSLLDNVELIDTLDRSKTTWEEVNESLRVAEETARQIEVASAQYQPCSTRAAILFFVLNDLGGEWCPQPRHRRLMSTDLWLKHHPC